MAIKHIGILVLRIGISTLLLILLFQKVNGASLLRQVRQCDTTMLAWAAAGVGVINALCLARWRILLRASGISLPLKCILRPFCAGLCFNVFMPTSIGGDVVRMIDLSARTQKAVHVATTVFLDRLMGYCGLVIVMLAACAVGWQYVQDPAVLSSVAIIASALILVLFAIFNGRVYGFVNRRLSSLNAGRISTVFKEAHEQLRVLGSKRNAVFAALGVSVLLQMISPVTSYLIGRSLGIDLDIRYFFIYMPIIGTITMLPVSIAGLGVREDATVRFFSKAGVGHDAALAMSLTGFFVSVLFAAAGGLYYVFTLHRRRV